MKQQRWGTVPGIGGASLYILENQFLRAAVSDYGATLVRLETPDRDGKWTNIILTYGAPADYAANTCYLGATVGRYANRIAGAAFSLGGETVRRRGLQPEALDCGAGGGPDHLPLPQPRRRGRLPREPGCLRSLPPGGEPAGDGLSGRL